MNNTRAFICLGLVINGVAGIVLGAQWRSGKLFCLGALSLAAAVITIILSSMEGV